MIGIINSSLDPFYNQALEEYLFQNRIEQDIFLLWRNRPAVIVGCYQNICQEVNMRQLKERGIPIVRRSSGGGTVYHDLGNVNYSLMKKRSKILEYDDFLFPVIEALRKLGIMAEKDRCSDIVIAGKKISGSAQKVTGERVLHHGTLLYDSDLSLLDEITTKNKSVHIQSKASPSAICKVCNICEHWEGLGKEGYPFREFPGIEAFMEALRETMGAKPEVLSLRRRKRRKWRGFVRKNITPGNGPSERHHIFLLKEKAFFERKSCTSAIRCGRGASKSLAYIHLFFQNKKQKKPFRDKLFPWNFLKKSWRIWYRISVPRIEKKI